MTQESKDKCGGYALKITGSLKLAGQLHMCFYIDYMVKNGVDCMTSNDIKIVSWPDDSFSIKMHEFCFSTHEDLRMSMRLSHAMGHLPLYQTYEDYAKWKQEF